MKGFTVIPKAVLEDDRLTLESKALLVLLLSQHQAGGIDVNDLKQKHLTGRDKFYRKLNELVEAGYLRKEEAKDGNLRRVKYVLEKEWSSV